MVAWPADYSHSGVMTFAVSDHEVEETGPTEGQSVDVLKTVGAW